MKLFIGVVFVQPVIILKIVFNSFFSSSVVLIYALKLDTRSRKCNIDCLYIDIRAFTALVCECVMRLIPCLIYISDVVR